MSTGQDGFFSSLDLHIKYIVALAKASERVMFPREHKVAQNSQRRSPSRAITSNGTLADPRFMAGRQIE